MFSLVFLSVGCHWGHEAKDDLNCLCVGDGHVWACAPRCSWICLHLLKCFCFLVSANVSLPLSPASPGEVVSLVFPDTRLHLKPQQSRPSIQLIQTLWLRRYHQVFVACLPPFPVQMSEQSLQCCDVRLCRLLFSLCILIEGTDTMGERGLCSHARL